MGLDNYATGSIRPQISVDKQVTRPELMYASLDRRRQRAARDPVRQGRSEVPPPDRRRSDRRSARHHRRAILQERYLYLVQPGGDAIRYGVGIGRDGFLWNGRANIQYGKKWPTWTPPPEMIVRKPELEKWRGGQPGGLDNPLGARALYIFKDGQDTGYRVHGSPEWWTIGQAMSSGCVRMINQDVIDLYSRVNGKTPIVVG